MQNEQTSESGDQKYDRNSQTALFGFVLQFDIIVEF